jgi:AcrR family transcriptional regulator
MAPEPIHNDITRERILDEAEKLFADSGFDAVSVRRITSAAETHLSAVNYHFGSKKNLYLAVFKERWLPRARQVLVRLEALEQRGDSTLDEVVRTLAEAFMRGFTDDEERNRHHRLIHMEMDHPTESLDMIIDQGVKPAYAVMYRLIRPHVPASVTQERLIFTVISIFAQVLHFNFGRSMMERISGRGFQEGDVEHLVEHIVRFSLYGLTAMFDQESGS